MEGPFEEMETVGSRNRRTKQAIDLAMQGKWHEAVSANQRLVESFPDDISAFNRLGRAYTEIGDFSHAMEAYRRALELDPYNMIAQKNLNRLSRFQEGNVEVPESANVGPLTFIEETGRAGVVNLHQLGAVEVLVRMVAGDKVNLKITGPSLVAENSRGDYLGEVEPRHASRLIKLMTGGNEYSGAIVNTAEDAATIIIRETYQHPSQVGRLSFPPKDFKSPRPYVSSRGSRQEPEPELDYDEEPEVSEVPEEEAGYTIVGVGDKDLVVEVENSEADDSNEE